MVIGRSTPSSPPRIPPFRGARAGGQQRSHAQIRGWADLAGESRFRGRPNAAQRLCLQPLRLVHILPTLIHLDPAGGATRTPTAHRGMRDTVLAQRFEHRCSRRNRHAAPEGESEHGQSAAATDCSPRAARGKRQHDEKNVQPAADHCHPVDGCHLRWRQLGTLKYGADKGGVICCLAPRGVACSDKTG
jgi:hypothetical protein